MTKVNALQVKVEKILGEKNLFERQKHLKEFGYKSIAERIDVTRDFDSYDTPRVHKIGLYKEVRLGLGERPMGNAKKFAEALSDPDTIIVSDLNLPYVGELLKSTASLINSRKGNANVIFLGNILSANSQNSFTIVVTLLSKIRTDNVFLILGPHDVFPVQSYIDFGFKYVTDRAEKTFNKQRLIYTYYPVTIHEDEINFHGHPGERVYSLMSKKNHYDCRLIPNGSKMKLYTLSDYLGGATING